MRQQDGRRRVYLKAEMVLNRTGGRKPYEREMGMIHDNGIFDTAEDEVDPAPASALSLLPEASEGWREKGC